MEPFAHTTSQQHNNQESNVESCTHAFREATDADLSWQKKNVHCFSSYIQTLIKVRTHSNVMVPLLNYFPLPNLLFCVYSD